MQVRTSITNSLCCVERHDETILYTIITFAHWLSHATNRTEHKQGEVEMTKGNEMLAVYIQLYVNIRTNLWGRLTPLGSWGWWLGWDEVGRIQLRPGVGVECQGYLHAGIGHTLDTCWASAAVQ